VIQTWSVKGVIATNHCWSISLAKFSGMLVRSLCVYIYICILLDPQCLPIFCFTPSAVYTYRVDTGVLQCQRQAINNKLDTGAAVSIITKSTGKSMLPGSTLKEECMRKLYQLKSSKRKRISANSWFFWKWAGDEPTLLGRNWNWLQHLHLDWKKQSLRTKDHT